MKPIPYLVMYFLDIRFIFPMMIFLFAQKIPEVTESDQDLTKICMWNVLSIAYMRCYPNGLEWQGLLKRKSLPQYILSQKGKRFLQY